MPAEVGHVLNVAVPDDISSRLQNGDVPWCAGRGDAIARAKTRAPKKSTKPRLSITMTPAADRYLKAIAKANQRSRAWVINYAINEIREKYGDNPAPVLPVRSQPFEGDEDR